MAQYELNIIQELNLKGLLVIYGDPVLEHHDLSDPNRRGLLQGEVILV